ncbi:MAG TPA: sulfite exporter TauE/SafE family protein [Polyangiaceae bacterium]|nr:sulfite exporter TauE/SafE family protein [Polyangiaceae bacterium]
MNAAPWLSVALASLLGSVHCAAMCGGFVAAYATGPGQSPARRAAAHLAYNAGRLVTYTALGALAGSLGRALDLAGRAAGLAHAAALVTAVLLVVMGGVSLARRPGLLRLGTRPKSAFASRFGALLARFRSQPAPIRAGVLGLSSTLLPCGWLYAFAAFAAATGSARSGAWLMSAFWVGSLPMLVGLGVSLQGAARRFERHLPRARSLLVLAVGVATLVSRLQLPAFAGQLVPAAASRALPTRADCPCHRGHAAKPSRDPAADLTHRMDGDS